MIENKPKIGFIGLGIMGKPMARNLMKAGYTLVVFNRSRPAIDELARDGAQSARSAREIAQRSDVIITMLPNSDDVEAVVLGESGILEGANPGQIIIDMSSIEPLVSQRLAAEAAKLGVEFLDAPVSGGEPGAIQGTLAIMVGGKEEIFHRCRPIFEAMGKTIVRVGDVGAGGFAKLANQIIVAINLAALGEAFVLAQKAGLDPDKLYQAISGGLAGSRVMDAKIPMIVNRNFKPGFKIKLHDKDLANALATAAQLQVPLPLTSIMKQILSALILDGKGEMDHGAIIQFTEQLAKIEVRKDR
ncbi:MAG: 2-hydroxy-3-oxopropionate reductase [candidate division KSB1 bacterium]|nr:2-hydroxy-3-oxopropionate reductase [candidate division KSB1 bacterium]MDZ7336453.1 2-hydroxy-3-oxopropionate reductase [candidate division KSB1 bacterium]MDZ7356271.1 2-hydroxy-3-oxopropionate reductase [candidate division KSB1 bacterium]MDZ7377111.1 2-hydroxy-3-oxopropionate reductase [candidate division KSB1 bacterium]MDZ7400076.1 2-hydroxy-3-oxopropionate reductase [candidate division KSB1 bacterium]